jgi:two-component system chemotaxis response regulator CheB
MPQRDIVVIGASAGGISALQSLVRALPADLSAAIMIVVHLSRHSPGLLPEILAKAGVLPAKNAEHGEPIRNGQIYVAPPDRHLLIGANRRIQLGHGPKENGFRPAVDPLFRSAALHQGAAAIGVVLSGGLDDGTAGLCAIKQTGGLAIVQNPDEAEVTSMPRSALRHVPIDYCPTAREIGDMLPQLLRVAPAAREPSMSDDTRLELASAADERNDAGMIGLGEPSIYTCPECGGSLMRVRNGVPKRFRCHTGHAFTAITLDDELRDNVENAAWSAVRALQEHVMLLQELVQQPGFSNEEVDDFSARAEQAMERARMLRETLGIGEYAVGKDH